MLEYLIFQSLQVTTKRAGKLRALLRDLALSYAMQKEECIVLAM
jgi:hypothetical protein